MLKTQSPDLQGQMVRVGDRVLTIQNVVEIANSAASVVKIAPLAATRLRDARGYVDDKVKTGMNGLSSDRLEQNNPAKAAALRKRVAIYGVTTGFGALKVQFLKDIASAKRLQKNIVLSHASGVGAAFDEKVVRAVMLVRTHTLARGYSGVRLELIEHLVKMLNCNILPVIPEQGSVGCSGDLAPLAHLALGLIGEGRVWFRESEYENLAGLKHAMPDLRCLETLDPTFQLSYKEGLALVNGISVTTALAVLNLDRALRLLLWADVIGSMTAEAILAAPRAFDKIVFDLISEHNHAAISASNVRNMTKDSGLMNGSEEVHDAYSVRCIPQVHGAVRRTLRFVESVVSDHLNTVDDDPVFFSEEEVKLQTPVDGWLDRLHFEGGHFHGAPVGYAMDFMSIAMTDLGSISERRIAMLLDKNHNRGNGEIPDFLTYDPDNTTSGVMIAQCTAAALVAENKVLAHPASVDSIPTSANHEDHVSMSTWAARKARNIADNVESVLAVELLCASLALAFRVGDLQGSARSQTKKWYMGRGTTDVYSEVRRKLENFAPFDRQDCKLYQYIDRIKQLLNSVPPTNVGLSN